MKPIWVVLITVVATAGLIGGGTYYYFNNKNDKDISALQKQLDELKKPVVPVVVDETADWTKTTLGGISLSIKSPASVGEISIPKAATTEDPSYFYKFSQNTYAQLGYSTGKVTAGRGGSLLEQYFWSVEKSAKTLITKDGATIGGFYEEKPPTESCEGCPGVGQDSVLAVYYKTGSMYSNIVILLQDTVANRAMAEKMIKSIAPVTVATTPVVSTPTPATTTSTKVSIPTCPTYGRVASFGAGERNVNNLIGPDKIITTNATTVKWSSPVGTFFSQNDKSYSVNWTYDVPGSYELTVTLSNSAGSCTAKPKVTVTAVQ
jgi:hypothetical protein